jgi:hypothetical protein
VYFIVISLLSFCSENNLYHCHFVLIPFWFGTFVKQFTTRSDIIVICSLRLLLGFYVYYVLDLLTIRTLLAVVRVLCIQLLIASKFFSVYLVREYCQIVTHNP